MAEKEMQKQEKFETVIKPKSGWFDFHFKELAAYKDLIFLFVKRTFTAQYKQTILGPAWAVIQPFLTTVVFTLVFGNLAGLSTDGIQPFVFYLAGTVAWNYFSGALTQTSTTFTTNSNILGKVYFPRLVMPISTVITQMISFAVQFAFFLIFWLIYWIGGNSGIQPNWYILLTPLLLVQMAMLGLGFGVIVSALTTKYRDLAMLVTFGVQLWMYASPVAYSLSIIPEKWMWLYMLNPMSPVIATFRYAYLGSGAFYLEYYLVSWLITVVVLLLGMMLFNHVEKTFMDTV